MSGLTKFYRLCSCKKKNIKKPGNHLCPTHAVGHFALPENILLTDTTEMRKFPCSPNRMLDV